MNTLGFELVPFGIGSHDGVVIWGRKPVSKRGIKRARAKSLPLLTVEDGFIRSLRPGWQEAPRSLTIDWTGPYFDANQENDLRNMLLNAGKIDEARARKQMALQVKLGISKYNAHLRTGEAAPAVYVIDQVRDDQSVLSSGGDEALFQKIRKFAETKFPHANIIMRGHPAGLGYFRDAKTGENTKIETSPANPFDLIEEAEEIITLSSQMGFDAIIAGKRPIVFGQPFYSGLGLSEDHSPPKTIGKISAETLYEVAINRYCHFFAQDLTKSNAQTEIFALHDEARQSALAHGALSLKDISAWKRPYLKRYFPNQRGSQILRWGERRAPDEWVLEDGFLRSRGLGAKLVPPLSLVVDRTGIYYDPSRTSDLETHIHAREEMHDLEIERAKALQKQIVDNAISKYNLTERTELELPSDQPILLVVGQVENDRSILLGATGKVKSNDQLIAAAKSAFPDHYLIYKPHPDVMANLRKGAAEATQADMIYTGEAIEPLWSKIDRLATISSLSGFEALLRGVDVSCFGMPFYADWGLTDDHAPSTLRRGSASLEALIYASLIDYPLYMDPKTRKLSTPEVIIRRLAEGETTYPWHLRAATWIQQQAYRLRDKVQKS